MADKPTKKDEHKAILVTNVMEEVLSLADWMTTVVHPWAHKKTKLAKSLLLSIETDEDSSGLFCKMIGRIIGEDSMQCKFCPLFLYGFLSNKETKDLLVQQGERPQPMRMGTRPFGTPHDGCLAVHASAVSREWNDEDLERAARESLWSLICVLSPLQLSFLFGTRNYFGKLIKKEMEEGGTSSVFNPLEESDDKAGDINDLFNPTSEDSAVALAKKGAELE